jgi:hypothetical protein
MKTGLLHPGVFLIVLAAASTALSQTKRGDMTVDVPFPFVVAHQQLPAGHYVVTAIADGFIRIYGPQAQGAMVPVHNVQGRAPASKGKVVFHCYDDTCFLAELWTPGNDTGQQTFRSRAEKEAARERGESQVAVVTPGR